MPLPKIDVRMAFGFCLLLLIAILAAVIAVGHVTQESSYGLTDVIGILAVLSGGFAQWAFSQRRDDNRKDGADVD